VRRLQGKVALVTGAARGHGAAIAEAFAAEGARLLIADIDEVAGRAAATRLGAEWVRLDVHEEMAWIAALARLLDSHGRLDVLVNSAGLSAPEPGAAHDPEHTTLADWQAAHRTRLDGVFLGCKHGLRAMRRSGGAGSIINVCAHPGGVVARHSRSVARHAVAQGLSVRCSSIHSGATAAGQPWGVAAIALMLAGDDARRVTGAEFHVDGGLPAGSPPRPRTDAA